jgi:uncharacterized integral membrane protein
VVASRSGSTSESGTGSSRSGTKGATNGRATAGAKGNGNGSGSGAKPAAASNARRSTRTSDASAAGATARARIASARSKARPAASRAKQDDIPIVDPTLPADDSVLAGTNAQRALSPDMPRLAWLRTQLMQMEQRQRDRLIKVAQLTVIAIVFITFVLQNAQGVNVHLLLFSVNIRLIWVIFGCAVLGGAAGYVIGRPDKSLRALLPQKQPKPPTTRRPTP